MADFRINVIVDPSTANTGAKQVERQLNTLEGQGQRLGRLLSQVFGLVSVSLVVRELVRLNDTFVNAQNRIRQVTADTAQLNAVTQELFEIAARTRVGFEATSTLYTRTALAVRNLGLTQRETLQFTESLNQAIVLSGATAQEASAGLIQLSQGLASGTLRGDELRSVLEQLPRVADVIAEQLGVTRGELRLLGQQGKISAETIVEAFQNARDTLQQDFAGTVPTIGQAFAVLRTRVIEFVAKIDEATGASASFARAIITLSDNLDVLGRVVTTVGTFLAINFARNGIAAAITGVRALGVAIAANPIGLLLVAIAGAIALFINFRDEIKLTENGVASLGDFFDELVSRVLPFIDVAVNAFSTLADFIVSVFPEIELSFVGLLRFIIGIQDRIIGTFIGTFNAIIAVFAGLPDALGSFFIDAVNVATIALQNLVNEAIKAVNAVAEFANLPTVDLLDLKLLENTFNGGFGQLGETARDAFFRGFDQSTLSDFLESVITGAEVRGQRRLAETLKKAQTEVNANLDERPEIQDRLPFALVEQLRLLEEEARLLTLGNREREIQNRLLDIEEKLRTSNVVLTGSQRELLLAAIETNQTLKEQADVLGSITGPQQELAVRQEALVALYDRGSISLQQLNDQLLQLTIAQSELNIAQGQGSFFDGFLVGIEQMLESVRNFSAEAGTVFANFFSQASEGFAQAIADSIIFGESIEESLGNVARRALADLLAGLVQLGIQYVLNASLGESLAASTTAAGVAEAGALSAAWAPAAAFASLASFGANAAPAQLGIASTVALSQGLALALKNGGYVSGPGGPRSDSIPAMLSNGEFVVNAKSTSRFRPQLEAMNRGVGPQNMGLVGSAPPPNTIAAGESSRQGTAQGTRIINVLDPNLMEDFLATPNGEKVMINIIERNSSSISQILRNT